MNQVVSKDGTVIAFDLSGKGPAVILVTGALTTRADCSHLAACLAPHFSVFAYDRRGRGESGDTAPYAVEREVEDRSEEHTSELQSQSNLVCRLLLDKKSMLASYALL